MGPDRGTRPLIIVGVRRWARQRQMGMSINQTRHRVTTGVNSGAIQRPLDKESVPDPEISQAPRRKDPGLDMNR